MRVIVAALLVVLSACGGVTEPKAPWYEGTWNAVSINGEPMPITFTVVGTWAVRLQEYQAVFTPTSSSFNELSFLIYTDINEELDRPCQTPVKRRVAGDTVFVSFDPPVNLACGISYPEIRTFVREGERMTYTEFGRRVVMERE